MSPVSDASPGERRRIGGGANPEQQDERDDRHRAMLHRPHAEAVRQLLLGDRGKWNSGSGPSAGRRERSTRVTAPPPVREPGDRKLRVAARNDAERDATIGQQVLRARGAQRARWRLLIAREVAVEESGLVQEHVVGVQLVGLAAEAADRLQPVDELRLRLRETALELVVRRPIAGQRRDLLGDDRSSSASVWPGAAVTMTWKKLASSREFWNAATSVAMRRV